MILLATSLQPQFQNRSALVLRLLGLSKTGVYKAWPCLVE
jgi:hypothetical protein